MYVAKVETHLTHLKCCVHNSKICQVTSSLGYDQSRIQALVLSHKFCLLGSQMQTKNVSLAGTQNEE